MSGNIRRQWFRETLTDPLSPQDYFTDDFEQRDNFNKEEFLNRYLDFFADGVQTGLVATDVGGQVVEVSAGIFYQFGTRVEATGTPFASFDFSSDLDGDYYIYLYYEESINSTVYSQERRRVSKEHWDISFNALAEKETTLDKPDRIKCVKVTKSGTTLTIDTTYRDIANTTFLDDSVTSLVKGWSSQKIINTILEQIAGYENAIISILNTPPGSPADNDRYIVGTSPTGEWVGKDNQIAQWNTEPDPDAWSYTIPIEGTTVYDQSQNKYLRFNGTAWEDFENVIDFDLIPDGATYGKVALTQTADEINNLSSGQLSLSFGANMFGLGGLLPTCTGDLNNIEPTGWCYAAATATNKPAGGAGYVLTQAVGLTSKVQIFTNAFTNYMYFRRDVTGTWDSWKQIYPAVLADANGDLDDISNGSISGKVDLSQTATEIDFTSGQISLNFGANMFGLGAEVKTYTGGLDTLNQTGFFYSTGANQPSGANDGFVLSQWLNTATANQTYYEDNSNRVWRRQFISSTWQNWEQIHPLPDTLYYFISWTGNTTFTIERNDYNLLSSVTKVGSLDFYMTFNNLVLTTYAHVDIKLGRFKKSPTPWWLGYNRPIVNNAGGSTLTSDIEWVVDPSVNRIRSILAYDTTGAGQTYMADIGVYTNFCSVQLSKQPLLNVS